MKSTPSATKAASYQGARPLLRAGFAVAGAAMALRAAGVFDFERGVTSLPSLCLFHRLTGIDCPGCGMTRAFLRLSHGDLAGAWHLHPFSVPLFMGMLALAFAPPDVVRRAGASKRSEVFSAVALLALFGWWIGVKLI